MDKREAIIPPSMQAAYDKIGYTPALRVGDTIYVSGQIGRDANMQPVAGLEAQIVQAFENLKLVIETAGASLADVVDLTTWRTNMGHLPLFMQVRDRYINADPLPAWTAVGAHMLGGAPGYTVEIKAVAVLRGADQPSPSKIFDRRRPSFPVRPADAHSSYGCLNLLEKSRRTFNRPQARPFAEPV